MPINKMAFLRYKMIDHCLRNSHKRWTRRALMDYLAERLVNEYGMEGGIAERTFYKDIQIMRSPPPEGFDAPIVSENGVYRYANPHFSIEHMPLTASELESLHSALDILEQFADLPHQQELQQVIQKLQGIVLAGSEDRNQPRLLLEKNPLLSGLDHLKPIYDAICRKRVLLVRYHPFNFDQPIYWTIHPYLLKEYNNRWFLLGYAQPDNLLRNLALDRIRHLEVAHTAFRPPDDFDPHQYFQHIIGVSLPEGGGVERIQLRVHPDRAPYLLTKPLHHSQRRLPSEDGFVRLELALIPNFELRMLLLSFGADVVVEAPQSLREDLQAEIRRMGEGYGH